MSVVRWSKDDLVRLWTLFIFGLFLLSGTRLGALARRRPAMLAAGCVVVGSLFYNYRFIR